MRPGVPGGDSRTHAGFFPGISLQEGEDKGVNAAEWTQRPDFYPHGGLERLPSTSGGGHGRTLSLSRPA